MADSKFFGGEKAPAGKEFRDSGSLGRGLKDLRKDVNVAFLTQEDHIDSIGTITEKTNADMVLDADTIFSDLVVYKGTADKTVVIGLGAVAIVAALNAKYAAYGTGRTAAVNDTIKLKVLNDSTGTLTVGVPGGDVTLDTGTIGGDVLTALSSADVYVRVTALLPAPAVKVLVAL